MRDDHSTLGAVVNEEAVGEQFPRSEAPLRRGENLVVADGADSPFAFQLVVGWRLPRPPHRIWMLCAETPADSPSRVGG